MTTLVVPVAASSDDCNRYDTTGFDFFDTSLYPDFPDSVKIEVGMRFLNITIAQGATINNAYVSLRAIVTQTPSSSPTIIKGQDADTTVTFSTYSNFDSRPRTTEAVAWTLPSPWTVDTVYNSPDIKAISQTIVNRAGWVSGNSMVIFLTGPRFINVQAAAYDYTPAYAPVITIDYGAAPPPAAAVPQLQLLKAGP